MEIKNNGKKIDKKYIVAGLMIGAIALPRMVDRATWYGSILSWAGIIVLIGCAIYEYETWSSNKKKNKTETKLKEEE